MADCPARCRPYTMASRRITAVSRLLECLPWRTPPRMPLRSSRSSLSLTIGRTNSCWWSNTNMMPANPDSTIHKSVRSCYAQRKHATVLNVPNNIWALSISWIAGLARQLSPQNLQRLFPEQLHWRIDFVSCALFWYVRLMSQKVSVVQITDISWLRLLVAGTSVKIVTA